MWPLWLYVTVVADVLMFSLGPVYIFMMSRIVFAWAMDRVIPSWFAKVSERTATPVRIYVLTLLGGPHILPYVVSANFVKPFFSRLLLDSTIRAHLDFTWF